MSADKMKVADACAGDVSSNHGSGEKLRVFGTYYVKCHDAEGNLLWEDEAPNLVTDLGGRLLLDTILSGSAFTATTYLGLKGAGVAVTADTQASHASWLEVGLANAPTFTGSRKTVTCGGATGSGAGSRTKAVNAGNSAFVFTSGSGATIDGCFLNINGTSGVDNTTGTLFSVGQFSGGARTVSSGDSLTVTYSLNC